MKSAVKRKSTMEGSKTTKRVKKECSYGESCFRRNPAHFREYSHPHLKSIMDAYDGENYPIPTHLTLQRHMILEQIGIIMEKNLHEPSKEFSGSLGKPSPVRDRPQSRPHSQSSAKLLGMTSSTSVKSHPAETKATESHINAQGRTREGDKSPCLMTGELETIQDSKSQSSHKADERKEDRLCSKVLSSVRLRDPDYRPLVAPTRRPEDYLKVVRPRGNMAAKHAASAPYHIFYTTISGAKETHDQPYSITFLEILDSSLGELKCSLQINFMVEISWLLAQYYFAWYSEKKLTILYEDDCGMNLREISKKKPQVDAHFVTMASPFGKHHTKMMILCYEDGSLRVVVSTANLYADDWENRTQGLWLSPKCPELPSDAMPFDGESPTGFKRSLLTYLNNYHMTALGFYIERVKRCDFGQINVFLVSSVPGSHGDAQWGLARAGALLRQHCAVPCADNRLWPLVAQASSLGSYGKEAKLWLTGDFLHNFTKIKDHSQLLSRAPELKLIYPSLENVRQSHDGLLGGGCLPYAADVHSRQPWLNDYLYQWRAAHTHRNRAMPHIKSYTRINKDATMSAFYLLTSANVSKAAWGQFNKGNGALRIMSYEAGVLLMPRFVINQDFFPLRGDNSLTIPYDLPLLKYSEGMSPWVSDYLH